MACFFKLFVRDSKRAGVKSDGEQVFLIDSNHEQAIEKVLDLRD